jgi:hypothetical protein
MQGFDDGCGVAGTVEEIRIAESDVFGAGSHLAANILQDDILLYHAKSPVVHGDHRAVPAQVFAAAARFGVACESFLAINQQLGISRQ